MEGVQALNDSRETDSSNVVNVQFMDYFVE